MDPFIIPVVGLLAAIAVFAGGSAIFLRKRLSNAEEARRRLKAGWEIKIREEEQKCRGLQQELARTQEASKHFQEALERKEREEQERQHTQTKQREHEKAEKELRDKTEKQNLARLTSELNQSIERLSQLQDEMKCMILELHKTQQRQDRREEQGRRIALKQEQPAPTERETPKRDEEEVIDRFGAKITEFKETRHGTQEEQAWLQERIRQSAREEGELRQELANEEPLWASERMTQDNDYREFIEQLDVRAPCLQEKVEEADAHRNVAESKSSPGRDKGEV